MEKLPGELLLMIFKFLSPTLITTYNTILYDTPFEEQFRLIEGLSSCQDVCKKWKSIADENPALFSREYCFSTASKEPKEELMSRGPHIKRLVVRLFPDNTSANNDSSSAGPSVTPAKTISIRPILEGLTVRTQLAYIYWDCRCPFTCPRLSNYPQLQNLTRLDWYFTLDTISMFEEIVARSPALEYITIMGDLGIGEPSMGHIILPASVTTIAIDFMGLRFDRWIKRSWIIDDSITLVAMVEGIAYKFLAEKATRIDLRPSLCTLEEEPPQALGPTQFEKYLMWLPRGDDRGTLAYSVIFFAPPSNLRPEEQEWVEVIDLKTSGRSHMTEGERWNALLPHLDLISHYFPSLKTIRLYYNFHNWTERPELHAFKASVEGRGIILEYILE